MYVSEKIVPIFILVCLAVGSLYMHSPLELKTTDEMYLLYQNNKESFSRDSITFPSMWYDNPFMMRHNFAKMVSGIRKITPQHGNALVFLGISLIFLLSIYLAGKEIFRDWALALVPCFFYFFGFMFPDNQGWFHDHELNARHLALSLVALSLYFYLSGKKTIAYVIAALICYIRLRNGYTWGLVVIAFMVKDLMVERNYPAIVKRAAITGFLLVPLALLTWPMMVKYDFSEIPQWAQYYPKISGPGGRSLVQLVVNNGWPAIIAAIIAVVNSLVILEHYKGERHVSSLKIIFVTSLIIGAAAGAMHDFLGVMSVSKLYLLSIFQHMTLANFFILSYLFVRAYKGNLKLLNLFTCFYFVVLVLFFDDPVFQAGLTVLILLRMWKPKGDHVLYALIGILALYMVFFREPHYINKAVELMYTGTLLFVPLLLILLAKKYAAAGRYFGKILIVGIVCLAVLSSIFGHGRTKQRYEFFADELDVCNFFLEKTHANAFVLAPKSPLNWTVYAKRLVLVPSPVANKMQFDPENILEELIARTDVMFEKGFAEKFFVMKMAGKEKEADAYRFGFWTRMDKEKLALIRRHYDIDFIIREKKAPIKGLETVHENNSFFVYRMPSA